MSHATHHCGVCYALFHSQIRNNDHCNTLNKQYYLYHQLFAKMSNFLLLNLRQDKIVTNVLDKIFRAREHNKQGKASTGSNINA